jgi:hypothetical protein
MGGGLLSCPTGRDVLDNGPVADDLRFIVTLGTCFGTEKNHEKNYKNLFRDDIPVLVVTRKTSQ